MEQRVDERGFIEGKRDYGAQKSRDLLSLGKSGSGEGRTTQLPLVGICTLCPRLSCLLTCSPNLLVSSDSYSPPLPRSVMAYVPLLEEQYAPDQVWDSLLAIRTRLIYLVSSTGHLYLLE